MSCFVNNQRSSSVQNQTCSFWDDKKIQLALKSPDFTTTAKKLLEGIEINKINENTGNTCFIDLCMRICKHTKISFFFPNGAPCDTSICNDCKDIYRRLEFLLKAGANPNIPNKKSLKPMYFACQSPNYKIVELFLNNGALPNGLLWDPSYHENPMSPLHLACLMKNERVTESLISKGASIYMRDCCRRTPLHMACEQQLNGLTNAGFFQVNFRQVNVMRLLILEAEKTENVPHSLLEYINMKDLQGHTPLHNYIISSHCCPRIENIEFLLKYGADVNLKDIKGKTVLHHCICKEFPLKDPSIGLLLIEYVADINAKYTDNKTLVQFAFEHGNDDFAKLFAENGAIICRHFPDGSSPIHKAMKFENIETIEFLFSKGMDVFLENSEGNIFKSLCKISEEKITNFLRKFFSLCIKQAEAKNKKRFENCIKELVEDGVDYNNFIHCLERCLIKSCMHNLGDDLFLLKA